MEILGGRLTNKILLKPLCQESYKLAANHLRKTSGDFPERLQ